MAACTRCGFQQDSTRAYCGRCGMFLPTLAIYNPVQAEYKVAPQEIPASKQRVLSKNALSGRMFFDRCIRESVAIVGLFIAGFGIFGFFHDILGSNWALLLGFLVLLGGSITVSLLFFAQKHLPRLRWPQIVLGAIVATLACFVTILILSAIVHGRRLGIDVGYGTTIFVYGLGIVALVMW